jgi:hypothetical protein
MWQTKDKKNIKKMDFTLFDVLFVTDFRKPTREHEINSSKQPLHEKKTTALPSLQIGGICRPPLRITVTSSGMKPSGTFLTRRG